MRKLNFNSILLIIGALLVGYGLLGPAIINNTSNNKVPSTVTVVIPLDKTLKDNCENVIDVFKKGSGNKTHDGLKLSSLYSDLAKLIALDEQDEIVKNTDEIRHANMLAGKLYNLDLQGKYPNLSTAVNAVVVGHLGDDNVVLDKELRKKAVDAFNGLAWAFYEGSK